MFDDFNKELNKRQEGAKCGFIEIEKVEGKNNERYPVGNRVSGYTKSFGKGMRCNITRSDHWFSTSMIKNIRWEDGEFDTLYSTYKFKFKENENSNL